MLIKILGLFLVFVNSQRVVLEPINGAHIDRTASKGYTVTSRAPADHTLRLSVAVKLTNLKKLEETLLQVSDPRSPKYGQHLTFQESQDLIAPRRESVRAVMDWLKSHGITGSLSNPSGSFISATVTVAQAESLLHTEYRTYSHQPSGQSVTRVRLNGTYSYSVPSDLAQHIDFVAPTVTFPPAHTMNGVMKKKDMKEPTPLVTPPILWKLYNITGKGLGKASNMSQGVASFIKQYYAKSDLETFWKKYHMPDDAAGGFDWTDVPKVQKHSPVGTEASLDVQWLSTSGQGINTEHWSTEGTQPGNDENEPFTSFLEVLAKTANAPSIFSISYGDEEDGVTEAYAIRCGSEFQAAGVRGISLLVASGDSGVGCAVDAFVPTFPASCPWVTGVGGLTGGSGGNSPTGESVAQLSGGGFSNYFARPSYQDGAVSAYLKQPSLPDPNQWNHTGAGFPDISAQALQFDTCTEDFFYPIDGTSCACPAASGVFSRLNQDRLTIGKSVLGFLNPMLYQVAPANAGDHVLNDVVDGVNDHCGDAAGFFAVHGWDAVSGWGSPNYGKLKQVLLALP